MASSVNYNTVWTSIFEPVSTFGFLERYGRLSELTKRHDLPYHVVGSDLAGVVLRVGPGREPVEARRRGRRALPVGGAGGPGRPRRHDDGPAAADLGLRDQLRRPGRARPGQEQPADAQARPPDLGGGRRPRAGQLHRLPAAGQPQRREHEAGRRRPDLGRLRRPGLLRHPDGAQRRRDPGLRRVAARRRPTSSASMGAELVIDRSAEGYQFWKDEDTQDPKEWQRLGQEDPRADRRRRRRHRLRAPRPGDLRRQRLRRQEGRHDRHLRLHQRLHALSTTTATCG